jgi:hypothetical protein
LLGPLVYIELIDADSIYPDRYGFLFTTQSLKAGKEASWYLERLTIDRDRSFVLQITPDIRESFVMGTIIQRYRLEMAIDVVVPGTRLNM